MIEHSVQTISLSYSAIEDRLEMRCKAGEGVCSLWLSQRLWKQLAPVMLKWLTDRGIGTHQSGEFIHQSMSESSPEPVVVPSYNSADELDSPSGVKNEQELNNESHLITRLAPEPWLCTTANINTSDQQIRFRLLSERSEHAYVFAMSVLEASHFLVAQRHALKESGWPLNWPEWLMLDTTQESSSDLDFLH